jgi:hypothetical protein
MSKMTYQSPKCEEIGNFAAVTKAATVGSILDATFPIGTPNSDLTFS